MDSRELAVAPRNKIWRYHLRELGASMHRYLFASVAALAFGIGAAFAADLSAPAQAPVYTKAPIAVPYSWTGFYVGGSVGADWVSDSAVLSLPSGPPQDFAPYLANGSIPTNYSTSGTGVLYGVQAGYNWQVQSVVLGLEADFSGSSQNTSQNLLTNVAAAGDSFGLAYATKVESIGTVRARIGTTAITPTLLAYASGGFAYGEVDHSYSESFGPLGGTPNTQQTFASVSNLDTGWTAGGGLEWALSPHVTVRGEYLFVRLSDKSFTTPSFNANCGVPNACSFTLTPNDVDIHIARVGVNYKF
jgi:outer membrane immunogenic protein